MSKQKDLLTEDAAALSFVARNPALRYCHSWRMWIIWDGKLWRADQTLRVFDLIRKHCRQRSSRFVASVERLVKSDRAYAITPETKDLMRRSGVKPR